jgi:hypothetical protein
VAKDYSLPHFNPSLSLSSGTLYQKIKINPIRSLTSIFFIEGFMAHFLTVTPMLHGGALTLGMDMVKIWRHISKIYGHYMRVFGEHFVKYAPFMGVLNM